MTTATRCPPEPLDPFDDGTSPPPFHASLFPGQSSSTDPDLVLCFRIQWAKQFKDAEKKKRLEESQSQSQS